MQSRPSSSCWPPAFRPIIAGLIAALALFLIGLLSVDQPHRPIDRTTVILGAPILPLSTAMQEMGPAPPLAGQLVLVVGDAGPSALLAGLFNLTAVIGWLISNMATALIVIPIGMPSPAGMGVSPLPVLMSVCVAAAGASPTPIATHTNLMVMGRGGCKFGEYWKLGLPLTWPF